MSTEKKPCCEAKVDALIAHKSTHWTAEDREWLLSQDENAIDKMSPKEGPKPEPIQVDSEEVITTFKETLKSVEDYTALMPEGMKAEVERGVKLYKEHRAALVKGIMDNSGENFSKEKLEAMDDDTLESIFKSVTPADYSGQGEIEVNLGEDDDDILYPTGYAVEKKED